MASWTERWVAAPFAGVMQNSSFNFMLRVFLTKLSSPKSETKWSFSLRDWGVERIDLTTLRTLTVTSDTGKKAAEGTVEKFEDFRYTVDTMPRPNLNMFIENWLKKSVIAVSDVRCFSRYLCSLLISNKLLSTQQETRDDFGTIQSARNIATGRNENHIDRYIASGLHSGCGSTVHGWSNYSGHYRQLLWGQSFGPQTRKYSSTSTI